MILFSAPSNVYAPLRRSFEATLDPAHSRMRITLTRENWPLTPDDIIGTIELAVAVDGVNYPPVSGCSTNLQGGTIIGRDHVTPVATDYVECSLPGVGTIGRKVKATCDNSQSLRTAITVEGF